MHKLSHSFGVLAILALLFAGQSSAQLYLREGTSGKVAWVSGGHGSSEIDALREREKNHTLKLVFTLNEGNYLSGIDIVVRDAQGTTVLEQRDIGPVLMARLPPGAYSLTATSDGRRQTRNFKVGERLRTEYLRWPAVEGQDFPLPPASRAPATPPPQ